MTKYRRGVLDGAMLTRCQEVMRQVCADSGADLVEFNGEHDHVHLLAEYPPKVAVSTLVNSLKGVSSRRLRQDFTGPVNRGVHARPLLVAQLPRRVLRRGTAEHHPAARRATKARPDQGCG